MTMRLRGRAGGLLGPFARMVHRYPRWIIAMIGSVLLGLNLIVLSMSSMEPLRTVSEVSTASGMSSATVPFLAPLAEIPVLPAAALSESNHTAQEPVGGPATSMPGWPSLWSALLRALLLAFGSLVLCALCFGIVLLYREASGLITLLRRFWRLSEGAPAHAHQALTVQNAPEPGGVRDGWEVDKQGEVPDLIAQHPYGRFWLAMAARARVEFDCSDPDDGAQREVVRRSIGRWAMEHRDMRPRDVDRCLPFAVVLAFTPPTTHLNAAFIDQCRVLAQQRALGQPGWLGRLFARVHS